MNKFELYCESILSEGMQKYNVSFQGKTKILNLDLKNKNQTIKTILNNVKGVGKGHDGKTLISNKDGSTTLELNAYPGGNTWYIEITKP